MHAIAAQTAVYDHFVLVFFDAREFMCTVYASDDTRGKLYC